jgi:hypothetical protein
METVESLRVSTVKKKKKKMLAVEKIAQQL